MKKRLITFLTVLLTLGFVSASFSEGRIAVVDLQSVLNNSKKGKEAIKMLENEFEKKKQHHKGIKSIILNPQLRFFVFEFLAFISISITVQYGWIYLSSAILMVWVIFSINYHNHLREYAKYE